MPTFRKAAADAPSSVVPTRDLERHLRGTARSSAAEVRISRRLVPPGPFISSWASGVNERAGRRFHSAACSDRHATGIGPQQMPGLMQFSCAPPPRHAAAMNHKCLNCATALGRDGPDEFRQLMLLAGIFAPDRLIFDLNPLLTV